MSKCSRYLAEYEYEDDFEPLSDASDEYEVDDFVDDDDNEDDDAKPAQVAPSSKLQQVPSF